MTQTSDMGGLTCFLNQKLSIFCGLNKDIWPKLVIWVGWNVFLNQNFVNFDVLNKNIWPKQVIWVGWCVFLIKIFLIFMCWIRIYDPNKWYGWVDVFFYIDNFNYYVLNKNIWPKQVIWVAWCAFFNQNFLIVMFWIRIYDPNKWYGWGGVFIELNFF